ncbi:hypothetical protein BN1012_Phect379 [Candidatus Phaeomarinobacter ectocarpi]|uniref:Uncharacterized protein n=1 Tax=Candidatus Phaeomarinibacter ectocarpi TaxID=1458461 RepID=X5M6F6_9HYPH|nr:hypothetical protein BN1012_Phect379 [Candidatus Phaeomarinobacter ectocarpi]
MRAKGVEHAFFAFLMRFDSFAKRAMDSDTHIKSRGAHCKQKRRSKFLLRRLLCVCRLSGR